MVNEEGEWDLFDDEEDEITQFSLIDNSTIAIDNNGFKLQSIVDEDVGGFYHPDRECDNESSGFFSECAEGLEGGSILTA